MDNDWREWASCVGQDPERWFPKPGSNGTEALIACYSCPVRLECLEDALKTDETGYTYGIRGGLHPGERDAVRRGARGLGVKPITCRNGHEVTKGNTCVSQSKRGSEQRTCLPCKRESQRLFQAKRRAKREAERGTG